MSVGLKVKTSSCYLASKRCHLEGAMKVDIVDGQPMGHGRRQNSPSLGINMTSRPFTSAAKRPANTCTYSSWYGWK